MLREKIITEAFAGYTVKIRTRRVDSYPSETRLSILPENQCKTLSRDDWLKLSAFVDAYFVREEEK